MWCECVYVCVCVLINVCWVWEISVTLVVYDGCWWFLKWLCTYFVISKNIRKFLLSIQVLFHSIAIWNNRNKSIFNVDNNKHPAAQSNVRKKTSICFELCLILKFCTNKSTLVKLIFVSFNEHTHTHIHTCSHIHKPDMKDSMNMIEKNRIDSILQHGETFSFTHCIC